MLLRRLEVFLLVLLLVTVGYHHLKDTLQWKRPVPLPPLRPFVPSFFPHGSFRKDNSTSVENGTAYRPLQQFVSRRKRQFYPTPL